jgi:hypothetical protein
MEAISALIGAGVVSMASKRRSEPSPEGDAITVSPCPGASSTAPCGLEALSLSLMSLAAIAIASIN